MKVRRISSYDVGYIDADDFISKRLKSDKTICKAKWVGEKRLSKAEESLKIIYSPYSILKLLRYLELNEYHSGCIEAIVNGIFMKFDLKRKELEKWFEDATFPGDSDIISILTEFMCYYHACGNGFLIKIRNTKGDWIGLERLLPNEVQIVERYDEYGFFKPDYIQVRNNQKRLFPNDDIIHMKKTTFRSNGWGIACLPIAMNIELLEQIMTFDYNNFKNGLLIDFIIIVEGGSLRDESIYDEDGNVVLKDAFTAIEEALKEVTGNNKSHGSILIETDSKDAKIRLEPMRRQEREGEFLKLKKDLREGIFSYHRVPARVVSQLVPGELGGDSNSDMELFYHFVLRPNQRKITLTLANHFNLEFGWNIKPEDFDFGTIYDVFNAKDEQLYNKL